MIAFITGFVSVFIAYAIACIITGIAGKIIDRIIK